MAVQGQARLLGEGAAVVRAQSEQGECSVGGSRQPEASAVRQRLDGLTTWCGRRE
jgi:hypothetical protein